MQDPATFQAVKPHFPELEQLKCPRCDSTNTKFCYYNNYNLSQPRHFCKNCRRYWTKGGALRNIPVGGGTRKNAAKKRQKADPDPNRTRKAQETPQHPASTMAAVAVTSTSSSQEAISSSVGRGGGGSDNHPGRLYGLGVDPDHKMLDITGSFSSLLATNGGFGTVLDGLNPTGSGLKMAQLGGFGESFGSGQNMGQVSGRGSGFDVQSDNNGGGSLMQSGGGNGGDSSCWGGGSNGWPDLAIYTPSSNFQ